MGSQQVALWIILSVTFALATVSILARFWSRHLTRLNFWWDDYAALSAYSMAMAWMVITPIWISKGLGLHIHDVAYAPVDKVLYDSKLLLYIAELFYAFSLFFGKVSILCFYWRIFSVPKIKMLVKILLGCAVVWIIFRIFMGIFHCAPIAYFWDASIPNGYCAIEDSKFFFGTLFVHVVMDICILSLPVLSIVQLHLPRMQKVGISVMFLFGIFVCVAAVMIMIKAMTFDPTSIDFTWNVSPIVLWATAEVNLVTVSTCLPTIKPAIHWCLQNTRLASASKLSSITGKDKSKGTKSYGLSTTKQSVQMDILARENNDDDRSTRGLTEAQTDDSTTTCKPENYEGWHPRGGIKTAVVGRKKSDSDSSTSSISDEEASGIQVKNETVVEISYVRPKSPGSPSAGNKH